MSIVQKFRGAAPVGRIEELPNLEMASIVYFRLWCDGKQSQREVEGYFSIAFGAVLGAKYFDLFSEFANQLARKTRRSMMRHGVGCQCFGGDESALANMITAAAIGDHAEAELLAVHLVPAADAKSLVILAQDVGLILHQMLERFPQPVMSKQTRPNTKH